MNAFWFPDAMREVHQTNAVKRVRDALVAEPRTARALAKGLRMTACLVSICITLLRRRGYVIENRDWCSVPGRNRKGTYYLISTPGGGGGGTGPC